MERIPGAVAGTVLREYYRLISPLGEGGMGAVWRAEDLRFGAPVAIKVMHAREAGSSETRARFEAEAKTAAKLRSPHIVQLLDAGFDPQTGVPFIAMELLEGETLRERLVRRGRLTPSEVQRIVTHVARALTRAHEQNIIHRDLKPANIFLVQNADELLAKVLDFGIAKHFGHPSPHGFTATGELLGTPIYMSPEQIRSSKDVDHRSDLWSLGVIAVECLTGKLPFDSDNLPGLALLISLGHSTLPSRLGPVPAGFDEWFQRATSLDPQKRFDSAAQMAEGLRQICVDPQSGRTWDQSLIKGDLSLSDSGQGDTRQPEPPSPPSVGPFSTTLVRRWLNPRRWVASKLGLAAGLVTVVALFGGFLALISFGRLSVKSAAVAVPQPPPVPPARPAEREGAGMTVSPTSSPEEAPASSSRELQAEDARHSALPAYLELHESLLPSRGSEAESSKPGVELPKKDVRIGAATRHAVPTKPAAANTPAAALAKRGPREPASGTGGNSASDVTSGRIPPHPPEESPRKGSAPSVEGAAPIAASPSCELLPTSAGRSLLAINPNITAYKVAVPPVEVGRGTRISAQVLISVSANGTVSSVKLLEPSSLALVNQRIPVTLSRWSYRPYLKQGRPTPFCYSFDYVVQ